MCKAIINYSLTTLFGCIDLVIFSSIQNDLRDSCISPILFSMFYYKYENSVYIFYYFQNLEVTVDTKSFYRRPINFQGKLSSNFLPIL